MRTRRDLIVCKGAEGVAFVRALVEIVRTEVERHRTRHELVAFNVERSDVGKEGAERRGRRTAAIEVARRRSAPATALRGGARGQRAERIVTACFEHCVL